MIYNHNHANEYNTILYANIIRWINNKLAQTNLLIADFIQMPRIPHGFLSLGMNGHPLSERSKPLVCEERQVL